MDYELRFLRYGTAKCSKKLLTGLAPLEVQNKVSVNVRTKAKPPYGFDLSNTKRPEKLLTGFTLIDVLVGTALFLIVFLGVFGAYQLGLEVVGQSKNKVTATAIANGQLEKIRNLPYELIGVQGSFPEGVLLAEDQVKQNNVTFKIENRVDYVVDDSDGIAPPEDECPNDYKRAEVKVSSLGRFSIEVLMTTDISPKNLAQECEQGGGILSVAVFNAFGVMIASPVIEIRDPDTDSVIKSVTPIDGRHYFSLEQATYKVVVSKPGFSSERTYSTKEVAIPANPHLIVLEGQLTEVSFSIDRFSSFSIDTLSRKDEEVFPVGDVTFNLKGEKLIGYDEQEEPIYKYSQGHISNAQGETDISDLEWDNYTFSIVSPQELNLVETEPGPQPIGLDPDTSLQVQLFLSAENALLVLVRNQETLEPVFSAKVRLYNVELEYNVTQHTNTSGKTYFIPLQANSYNYEVDAAGYAGETGQVSISGETETIIDLEQVE